MTQEESKEYRRQAKAAAKKRREEAEDYQVQEANLNKEAAALVKRVPEYGAYVQGQREIYRACLRDGMARYFVDNPEMPAWWGHFNRLVLELIINGQFAVEYIPLSDQRNFLNDITKEKYLGITVRFQPFYGDTFEIPRFSTETKTDSIHNDKYPKIFE